MNCGANSRDFHVSTPPHLQIQLAHPEKTVQTTARRRYFTGSTPVSLARGGQLRCDRLGFGLSSVPLTSAGLRPHPALFSRELWRGIS